MTKPLITTSIAAPGFYGLNTQDSEVTLNQGFARNAENCIIDEGGRLGSRKGWQYVAQTNPVSTVNLTGLHRHVDVNGDEYFGCWSDDNYFYIRNGDTLIPVTYSGSQTDILNHTAGKGNWQAVSLFDAAYLVQEGFEPIYFDPVAGVLNDISNAPSYSATSAGVASANTALAAYGRLWIANDPDNRTTIWWSDLLSGEKWNSGTAGSLDISTILQHGNDTITAIGAHNGFLIIFCTENIIIFADSDDAQSYLDPATLQLVEVISGVGCVARDSVQNTGTDIVFLSSSGLRSLGRTIQEKSQPINDISRNIRDTLVSALRNENLSKIKSCYSEHNAFYLLALPTSTTVYCFDMRGLLENGSARVTRWNGLNHTNWLAYGNEIYMSNAEGVALYRGYQDNGDKYQMQYYTNYFNFDMPNQIKIVKNIAATVVGSTGQKFVAKLGTDYEDIYNSYQLTIKEGSVSEYNISEYNGYLDPSDPSLGNAEYSGAALIDNVRIPAGGSGFVIQLGFESTINGGFLNIQQIDLYVKQGRLN